MSSRVHAINVSAGGVPKQPIPEAMVTVTGLHGDRQRHRRFHGGPLRAVCLYSLERIHEMNEEGHPIAPGTVGENLTITGLDWTTVVPGTVLRAGQTELEVTSYAEPCHQIRNSFVANNMHRIAQTKCPGWSRVYAKVLKEGVVRVGDAVSVLAPASTNQD